MKKHLLLLLMLLSPCVFAQTINQTFDCTNGCRLVSDPFPLGPAYIQPVKCRLYYAATGAVAYDAPIANAQAVGVNYLDGTPAPAGSVVCYIGLKLPPNVYSYQVTAWSADNQESPKTPVFTVRSTRGAPSSPGVLRLVPNPPPTLKR